MKNKLSMKLIAFSLVLCIIFTSAISAYTDAYTVKADYEDDEDVLTDLILLVCTIGGMIAVPQLELPLFISGLVESLHFGVDARKYFTDNGDGTATISADTVQMIMDSAYRAQSIEGFGDSDIALWGDDYKTPHRYYATMSGTGGYGNKEAIFITGTSLLKGRLAGYYNSNTFGLISLIITEKAGSYNNFLSFPVTFYMSGKIFQKFDLGVGTRYGIANPSGYTANFPVFSDYTSCENYVRYGTGYKDALNYNPDRKNFDFRYGSNFNPTYSGGDVTINLNRLSNFTSYYTQVINNNPDKDTDDLLKILLDYIKGDSYDLALSRHDNNIIETGSTNTIEVEILTNIESPDFNSCLTWHGINIGSVTYSGNIASIELPAGLHEGDYSLSAVYDNGSDIYIISPSLNLTVKEKGREPETEPVPPEPDEPSDAWIKIKSAGDNDYLSLSANQREFFIDTNLNNPYYESCLTWYPLNGVENVQYTNTNTAILTFKEYSKRYNVYCKYIDSAKEINITSNVVSATTGAQDTEDNDKDRWDKFIENVYQFFDDLMNKLEDIFYDSKGVNFLMLIHEDITILIEQFEDFAADCLNALKDLKNGTGSDKQLPSVLTLVWAMYLMNFTVKFTDTKNI